MEVLELAGIGEIKVRRSANIKYLRIRMAPGRGVWGECSFRREPETGGEISGRESGVDSQKPERYESL